MKQLAAYCLHKSIYFLLLLLIFVISCNRQNQTCLPKVSGSGSKKIPIGQLIINTLTAEDKGKSNAYVSPDIIQCAFQDKAGNLWFGTGQGVFCYDGKSFTNYTEKDGLCNNEVGSICEDKTGNLWFGTNSGASRYDGKTFTSVPIPDNRITHFPNDHQSPNRVTWSNVVTGILQDKTGNIWFGTLHDGVYRYDGKIFTNFLSGEVVKCIFEDKTGNIWVGSWSNGGVYRYNANRANNPCLKNSCKHDLRLQQDQTEHAQEIAKSAPDFTRQNGLSDDMIACIVEDKTGNLWFGTRDHGVCRYDGKSFTNFSTQEGLCNNNISCISIDKTGTLWFGSAVQYTKPGGVCRYDGKSFTYFTTKEGLENNDIFCSIADKRGYLWFGGRYGRLFCYDGKSFTDFSEEVHE